MNHCLNDVRPSKCLFLFASIYKGNKSVLLQNDTNRGVSSFFAKCFNYLCLKSFYGSEQNEVVYLLCSTNLTNGKNWQEENNLVMCGLHSLAFCITLSVNYIIVTMLRKTFTMFHRTTHEVYYYDSRLPKRICLYFFV